MLIGGLFAIIELVKKRSPQAAEVISKISGFQGYIGAGIIVFSIWNLVQLFRGIRVMFKFFPVSTVFLLVALITGLLLGVLQSIDLARSFKKLPEDKLKLIDTKLSKIRIPLGFCAIVTSIYLALAGIIHFRF